MKYILVSLLFLIGCQYPRYEKVIPTNVISGKFERSNIDQYIITKIGSLDHEKLLVLFYKNATFLDDLIIVGKTDRVEYSLFDLLAKCQEVSCNGLVIAHNHPNQYFAQHSEIDSKTAKTNAAFFDTFKVNLIANIVVTEQDSTWY